jgi:uncharacterized protein (UPF0333 family)
LAPSEHKHNTRTHPELTNRQSQTKHTFFSFDQIDNKNLNIHRTMKSLLVVLFALILIHPVNGQNETNDSSTSATTGQGYGIPSENVDVTVNVTGNGNEVLLIVVVVLCGVLLVSFGAAGSHKLFLALQNKKRNIDATRKASGVAF